MRIVEHGWLRARPDLDDVVNGVFIPKAARTRKEEYTFALEAAPEGPGGLLDVATGFIPEWHLFATIMANAGWIVEAVDSNPEVMNLPEHYAIRYSIADGRDLPFADASFDYVTCISTLEHLSFDDQRAVVAEMLRCCMPGGRIVVTADEAPWLPLLFGETETNFELESLTSAGLSPAVYYIIVDV